MILFLPFSLPDATPIGDRYAMQTRDGFTYYFFNLEPFEPSLSLPPASREAVAASNFLAACRHSNWRSSKRPRSMPCSMPSLRPCSRPSATHSAVHSCTCSANIVRTSSNFGNGSNSVPRNRRGTSTCSTHSWNTRVSFASPISGAIRGVTAARFAQGANVIVIVIDPGHALLL